MELSLLEFPKKLSQAYTQLCKPLCRELGLSQTALDILLFLANNPRYQTAGDIVEVRHIPASLVSVNVERLVQDGLLRREPVPGSVFAVRTRPSPSSCGGGRSRPGFSAPCGPTRPRSCGPPLNRPWTGWTAISTFC